MQVTHNKGAAGRLSGRVASLNYNVLKNIGYNLNFAAGRYKVPKIDMHDPRWRRFQKDFVFIFIYNTIGELW